MKISAFLLTGNGQSLEKKTKMTVQRRVASILLLCFLGGLISCASSPRENDVLARAVQFKERGKAPADIAGLREKSLPLSDYKIGPEDLLEIEVFQVGEMKTLARVSARGDIRVPLAGRIKASGMTVAGLEADISERLRTYIADPLVSVFIREYRSQRITVIGEIKEPHTYMAAGQKFLLDIISEAGGLTDQASSICYVQRGIGDGEEKEIYLIDLNELLLNGRTELNIPLESGDVVHIPRAGVFFVDGAVESPGYFKIENRTTLTQALSMAKGLKYEASRNRVRVYREKGGGEREVLEADYDSILKGEVPDLEIEDRDIIIVSKNGMKEFIKGLTSTLNLGILSVGKNY